MNVTKDREIWLISGAALLLLILDNMNAWKSILKTFLPAWEGFTPVPKWDYKQWSWGYGTKVPGSGGPGSPNPGGSITRAKAIVDALNHANSDYLYLKGLIKTPLKDRQWAALLSFSYNEGAGNADNLVSQINASDTAALESHWKQFIYAGGQINQDLIDRRNAEWDLFVS